MFPKHISSFLLQQKRITSIYHGNWALGSIFWKVINFMSVQGVKKPSFQRRSRYQITEPPPRSSEVWYRHPAIAVKEVQEPDPPDVSHLQFSYFLSCIIGVSCTLLGYMKLYTKRFIWLLQCFWQSIIRLDAVFSNVAQVCCIIYGLMTV